MLEIESKIEQHLLKNRCVRLVDLSEFPNHAPKAEVSIYAKNTSVGNVWEKWRGTRIIIGPAKSPNINWVCGTVNVFQVLWTEIGGEVPQDINIIPYICEHQFEEL